MADQTIDAETATTTMAAGDEFLIWRVANGDTRKITKSNAIGMIASGGGTIATGGNNLTVAGDSTINGSLVGNMTGSGTLATAGFTLTVPATGTAAILATAQTFTGLKTFSAGLSLGQDTLSYYDEGTWTPTVTFGGSSTGITYSTQTGNYTRIGNYVYVTCVVALTSRGGLSGTIAITGLPFAASSTGRAAVKWDATATSFINMICSASTTSIVFFAATAAAVSSGNSSSLSAGNLTDTSVLSFGLGYLV